MLMSRSSLGGPQHRGDQHAEKEKEGCKEENVVRQTAAIAVDLTGACCPIRTLAAAAGQKARPLALWGRHSITRFRPDGSGKSLSGYAGSPLLVLRHALGCEHIDAALPDLTERGSFLRLDSQMRYQSPA